MSYGVFTNDAAGEIKVEFIDFRKYKIILEFNINKCEFIYTYNVYSFPRGGHYVSFDF